MGFFDGFIGGAAETANGILGDQIKSSQQLDSQKALAQFNAELNEQKEKTLMVLREEMANAPLRRIGTKAKEFAGQDVPVEAAPVTELSGQDPMLAANTQGQTDPITSGMSGNYADLVAKAKTLPIEDQQPYLDQLKRQFGADTATAKQGILGQTRKRTSDEALNAAAEDAKVNDPVAYAAYQREIGKPLRDERRVDKQDRDADIREKKNDAESEDRKRRADWLQTHQTEKLELDREIAKSKLERGVGDAKDPSEVASTKWLMANKDDPVAMEMWNKVHQSKSKSIEDIAASFMEKDMTGNMTAAEAVKKATELSNAAKAMKQAKPDAPITQAEYAKLPSGAIFTAPDGTKRRKP